EIGILVLLTGLNIRGVRESVLTLLPVFLLFLVTHALLIGLGLAGQFSQITATVGHVGGDLSRGKSLLGLGGVLMLVVRAYSLGGGTYTGIEAVSNGLPIMREPRVRTAKRTMIYMGTSLAFTASGLLVCYLLWHVAPVEGKTMNTVLTEKFVEVVPLGKAFVWVT